MSDGDPQPLLLKQYEYLRSEIIQCIYLRQVAVIGLFTSYGAAIGALLGWKELMLLVARSGIFGLAACGAAFVANCFGSLYVHEQARNRRACSFNKAIEYLVTALAGKEKQGPQGFLLWENFITADEFREHGRVFYFTRAMALGLPILLFTVPTIVALQLAFPPWSGVEWFGMRALLLSWSFGSSALIALGGVLGAMRDAGRSPLDDHRSRHLQFRPAQWLVRSSARFGECDKKKTVEKVAQEETKKGEAAGQKAECAQDSAKGNCEKTSDSGRRAILVLLRLVYVAPAVALLFFACTASNWSEWSPAQNPGLDLLTSELASASQLLFLKASAASAQGLAIAANLFAIVLGLWATWSYFLIASQLRSQRPCVKEVLDWLARQGRWIQGVLGSEGAVGFDRPSNSPEWHGKSLGKVLRDAAGVWSAGCRPGGGSGDN